MFDMSMYIKTGIIKNETFKAKPDESLKCHTNNVLKIAKDLTKAYPHKFTEKEKDLLYLACQVHDYGKINEKFQEKINKNEKTNDGEIHHNFLSPMFLDLEVLQNYFNKQEIKNLVTSIYYHHVREEEKEDIKKYYQDYMEKNVSDCFEKRMKPSLLFQKFLLFHYPNNGEDDFDWPSYAKLKGLLQKCDYAGSARLVKLEQYNVENRQKFLEKIESTWTLNPLQKFMKENWNENLIVIAPTGMGKTEASFLWSNMDKTFYTLPLRVASNAIYERAKKIYNYQDVALLHSDAFAFLNTSLNEEKINSYEKYKITKQLGDSLTITTIDQLFKFPLKALGHELLFATLTYSKVIIDEIQMYSSTIIACIIVGISYLIQKGGKFAITTATLPPIFLSLLEQNGVKQDTHYKLKEFLDVKYKERHRITLIDEEFQENLILEQAKNNKVLVICNTVKKSQKVYRNLKDKNVRVNLLHSKFIKKDRTMKEDQILKETENGVWICTQIVEASLDIDFDILHTDLSTIDSLLQRMGRCYRKRNIDHDEPNIYIYNTKEGLKENKKGIYDPFIYDLTWEKLQNYNNQILKEEDKLKIVNEIYNKEQLKNSDYLKELEVKIARLKQCYPGRLEQKEVDDMFRNIHDITVIPEEIFEENQTELNDLKEKYQKSSGLEKLNYQNELLKYTLQIPSYHTPECNKFVGDEIYRVRFKYDKNEGLIYEKYSDLFG